ncbi:MAG: hypothetical protein OIF50_00340 [Flavobacteriaceae bacterium]|nr:hypothetical protein [Flavobacteriaceae bacterium]
MITISKQYFWINRVVFIFVCWSMFSCSNLLQINSVNLNEDVKIIVNKESGEVIFIQFPFKININNLSNRKKDIIKIAYEYHSTNPYKSIEAEYYFIENSRRKRVSSTGKKSVPPNGSITLKCISRHNVEDDSLNNKYSFTNKKVLDNPNPLRLSKVEDFKKKHPGLLERLTKNDSISITLLNSEDMPGEVIKVPVRY